ncbi:L-threonylcarbamoyladenylate synthase [Tranquillimonas alkanivorans]|uniref:Threonylcarbamoyl-AMP synthase n=1 Tax=Tranquillimonas alkanivorans TaxID=441119 RepID=A0A1I5KWZ5_9RHOB|nr:L-threonylcarbamoyladenylate synthase [Tranquillimonas alkanivorans]SFO89584.1 translation factor SUA5 [Tranquillimonas alkanivorans]
MQDIATEHLQADEAGIDRAAWHLRHGHLVALPTETVYGLGADATDDLAVARIFGAKQRPRFNPLILHVPDLAAAQAVADLSGDALRLAEAFWPGPLTLLAPLREEAGVAPLVTAGHDRVAVRVPDLDLTREVLRRAAVPVAAPSANISGKVSPTRAEHVLNGLSGRIEAVLDGGPCTVGVESTIVGFDNGGPRLLRPGGLPAEALAECLGTAVHLGPDPETPIAPGQMSSHYAPSARLRLGVTEPLPGETLLGFGPTEAEWTLSRSGDLTEAAARLFHVLREMDAAGIERIAVAPIPMTGLGLAINDRLSRAAAPR